MVGAITYRPADLNDRSREIIVGVLPKFRVVDVRGRVKIGEIESRPNESKCRAKQVRRGELKCAMRMTSARQVSTPSCPAKIKRGFGDPSRGNGRTVRTRPHVAG